jgi:hypothetical protein
MGEFPKFSGLELPFQKRFRVSGVISGAVLWKLLFTSYSSEVSHNLVLLSSALFCSVLLPSFARNGNADFE